MDYVYTFLEVLALILFFIRIGHHSFIEGKAHSPGLLLTGFMTLWTLNILIHYLPWEGPSFYLSHAFEPTFITFAILLDPKKNTPLIILGTLLIGLLILWISSMYFYVGICYLAIGLLLARCIKRVRGSKKHRQQSLVYFFIAFSLFASLINITLKSFGDIWHSSTYLSLLRVIQLAIYSSTFIIIHVRFRRFYNY